MIKEIEKKSKQRRAEMEMEEGWQRQVDTVITIIDVICLSFISANVCCILFVLLDVKIKYANGDRKWMFLKWMVVRHCHLLYPIWATKHFCFNQRQGGEFQTACDSKMAIFALCVKGFHQITKLIPSSFCQRILPKWEDKMDKIYYPVQISQAFLTISWVITEKVKLILQ